jgi:outer membrane protein assembly factor BamB
MSPADLNEGVEGRARPTRRGFLLAGAAAVGSLHGGRALAALAETMVAAGAEWPMPAHDLGATRHGTPVATVAVRWRRQMRGGVASATAIVDHHVVAASVGGIVGSYRLAEGKPRWQRDLGTARYGSGKGTRHLGFFGGVAVADRRAFVAAERVHALDVATGRTVWLAEPLRTTTSDDYFWGPPTVASGLVLVGSGSGAELPTARGRLSAYSIRDGRLVWSTPMVPAGANGGGVIAPVTVDTAAGEVYVATGAPYSAVPGANPGTCSLVVLSLETGAVLWSDQVYAGNTTGFDFNSAPVIVGPLLVASNKDGIYAWDRLARRRLWHRRLTPSIPRGAHGAGPTSGPEGGPVATDGTRIFVLSNDAASNGCIAAALSPASGHVLWRRALPAQSYAAPGLAGERLCVPGVDGTLRFLDAADGSVAAAVALGQPSSAPPSLAERVAVVGTGAAPFIPGNSLVCVGRADT